MSYMLIEIRGLSPPILTKLVNEPDQDFINNLDDDFEMLVRSDGTMIEQYISGQWKPIQEV